MKFNVSGKTLYAHTSAVSKVINNKNALSILDNFLMELDGNQLTITGSDTENALSTTFEVQDAEGRGSFCINARRLVDLIKKLTDQGITFTIDDETFEVEIKYLSGVYNFVALSGIEYPSYTNSEEDEAEPVSFTCPAKQLIKGIDNTLFAVGDDDARQVMCGVYLDIKPENITFVSTDTRKMVRYINSMAAPGIETSCIMPIKPATVIKNVFDEESTLNITMTNRSATISNEDFTFNCRFIKGRYPDYTRVIPQSSPYKMIIDKVSFENAVSRAGVFVDPGFGLEKFKVTPTQLFIKCEDANLCTKAHESLPCSYDGPEMVIGFSANYLLEICNILTTSDIVVELTDSARAGVFRPSEMGEGEDLLVLLMPMGIREF